MRCILGSGDGVQHRCIPPTTDPAAAYGGAQPREHVHGERQTPGSDEHPKDPHSPQFFPSTVTVLEEFSYTLAAAIRYEKTEMAASRT